MDAGGLLSKVDTVPCDLCTTFFANVATETPFLASQDWISNAILDGGSVAAVSCISGSVKCKQSCYNFADTLQRT